MWKKAAALLFLSMLLFAVFANGFRSSSPLPATPPLSAAGGFEYGNNWYNPGNNYVKLKIWENGVYRVTAADLAASGFSLNGIDPANLHLVFRGEEQYIYVEETGGVVDFLEFYGKRNDGKVDSIMYRDPNSGLHDNDQIPNIHLSAFSDTSAYFLTYDNSPGLRYQTFLDTNYSSYPPESFFRYEAYKEYHPNTSGINASWNKAGGAQYDPFHILNSYWITGEGYVGPGFSRSNRLAINIPTPYPANIGNPSLVKSRIFGRSSWEHILTLDVNNNILRTDTFSGVYIKTRQLLYSNPLSATTQLGFLATGNENNTDNNNYCWSSIEYDRLFNLGADSTIKMVSWDKPNSSYCRFENVTADNEAWIFDLDEHTRIQATLSGDTLKAIVPGGSAPRQMQVVTDRGIKNPLIAQPSLANLKDPAGGAQFVIITHRSLANSAIAYKNYRDTNTVNQLSAKVVFVDEIYDEFSYGTIHPWGIKRFCKYAIDNWNTTPEYFLLWGKGQYKTRNAPKNMVPTPCYPASDYEYVSDFDPNVKNAVPEVPIGRVNCENNIEGFNYLNKVNEYEHTHWAAWMKEVVFLGGGENIGEQNPILNYFKNQYGPVVAGPPAGGQYSYYQKYNTGQVTNSSMPSTDRINAGVSVIHFFGHSSSNIYDVDIKEPILYQNYGKYPLMIAFGCYGGDFVGDGKSFGERFVLEPERGSIGYLANSTAGFLSPLGNLGTNIYPMMFGSNYGGSIGTSIKNALQTYWNVSSGQTLLNHAKQINLQGDPAIRLYSAAKPDLEITASDVYFSPSNFSAADSVFEVNIVARNLGRVTQDSFYVSLRQRIPSTGDWITYPSIYHGPIDNIDTISMTINNTLNAEMAGLNTFDIFIDSTDIIDEYQENNNRVLFDHVVPGNFPAILFPYDFAVVEDNRVSLSASAFVMGTQLEIPYLFEIDTTPTFNSPAYTASPTVKGSFNFAEWDVPFTLTDSMVYYWRVRLQDILPATWASASFKYINTKNGWAQSRPPQFFSDPTKTIAMDKVNHIWNFDQYAVELHAFVNQGNHGAYRLANGAFSSTLPSQNYSGILHTAIRSKDLIPTVQRTLFGDWIYSEMPDTEGDVTNALFNVAEGDYFLAVSEGNPEAHLWSDQLIRAFALIGGDTNKIKSIPSGNSFIIFGKKGEPNQGITITEPNIYDATAGIYKFDLRKSLQTNYSSGHIISTSIGPATQWFDMTWDWKSLDQFPQESIKVSVYAVRTDNTDSLVYTGLPLGNYSLLAIDASSFPFLRLEAQTQDSIYLTAPQLEQWHVIYNPAPDALIDPTIEWTFDRDTVRKGESISVQFTTRNITENDMDSLLVRFSIKDINRTLVYSGTQRYAPLPRSSSAILSHSVNTVNFPSEGHMTFNIEINPDKDQPEQYQFNNYYEYNFFIDQDLVNPILDVTVNGKHLMAGDIVSPNPEILMEINDDNPFLLVSDTAFEVSFGYKTPNSANLPRVFIKGNPQMEVVPAQLPDNKARLYFRPGPLDDGEYTIRVQGYDQSGNPSGKVAYEMDFTVINRSSLSDVLNYPNPFSTSTRFVYTLTGNEIPERFELHIYSISGKLVNVIDLVEMNDIKIGRNITDYAWDGKDEFGDVLANGVYIYKVIAKLNGEAIEYRDEGGPATMENGFGKLYIMR